MGKIYWEALNASTETAEVLKGWLQQFDAALLASGLVRLSDLGQLNIAAISAVPAAGTYLAPLVYRMADSRQAAEPVILRFRPYVGQHGGSSYLVANLALSIGTATDGQGNLISVKVPEFNFYNSGAGNPRVLAASPTGSYAIHHEARFALCLGMGAYRRSADALAFNMLFIDLSRGAAPGEINVSTNSSPYDPVPGAASASMLVRKLNTRNPAASFRVDMAPWVGGSEAATLNGVTQMQRTYRLSPGVVPDPCMALYWRAVVADHSQFSLEVDGLPRTYIALGANAMVANLAVGTSVGLAMLWDDL